MVPIPPLMLEKVSLWNKRVADFPASALLRLGICKLYISYKKLYTRPPYIKSNFLFINSWGVRHLELIISCYPGKCPLKNTKEEKKDLVLLSNFVFHCGLQLVLSLYNFQIFFCTFESQMKIVLELKIVWRGNVGLKMKVVW